MASALNTFIAAGGIFFLPLYLTLVQSFVLIQLPRRAVVLAGTKTSTTPVLRYVVNPWVLWRTTAPLTLLWAAVASLFRGFEGFYILGQLYVTPFTFHMLLALALIGVALTACLGATWPTSTSAFYSELFLALNWLPLVGAWALMAANLISFLLCLELLLLFLLLALTSAHVLQAVRPLFATNWKPLTGATQPDVAFGRALLLLLWVSLMATSLILWSLAHLYAMLLSFELRHLPLLVSLTAPSTQVTPYIVLLFLGLFLKTAFAPVHFWLYGFYSQLGTPALLLYNLVYYPLALLLSLVLVFGHLGCLVSAIAVYLSLGSVVAAAAVCATLSEVSTLRAFFAYSSVINLALLLLALLVL